jgi:hypothetical protein
MMEPRSIYLHRSDVEQARDVLMGEGVEDVYWKALLVACWLKGDPDNRARLESVWPALPEAIRAAEAGR